MSDTPTEVIPPPIPSVFERAKEEVKHIIEEVEAEFREVVHAIEHKPEAPAAPALDPNDPRDQIILAQIAESKK